MMECCPLPELVLRRRCLLYCSLLIALPVFAEPDTSGFALLRQEGLRPEPAVLGAWLRELQPEAGRTARARRLIAELGSAERARRDAAQAALLPLRWFVGAELEAALGSRDAEIRQRARALLDPALQARSARLLGAVLRSLPAAPPDDAARLVAGCLRLCTSRALQEAASRSLLALAGPADRAALTRATADEATCAPALIGLGGCGPEAVAVLEDFAGHADPGLRLAAGLGLARAAPERALPVLVAQLDDPEAGRRRTAHFALEQLGGETPAFSPFAAPAQRDAELAAWHAWLAAGPRLVGQLKALRPPRALRFLVASETQVGVHLLTLSGERLRTIPCKPYDAQRQPDGSVVVAERSGGRVVVFDEEGAVLREALGLAGPCDVEMLPDGNLLVLENGVGRVSELDLDGERVWSVDGLDNPYDVDRLADGHTLVADSGGGRLVEFDAEGKVVWEVPGLDFPNGALRLDDGRTLFITYTRGTVGLLDARGETEWTAACEGATLFSLGYADGVVYVSDGAADRVFRFDLEGRSLGEPLALPNSFVDVHFAP